MDFYVYLHRKKTTGEVFYVGKGSGRRAWEFGSRNKYWRNIEKSHGCIVDIYADNLQEWYALELERDLILKYGRRIDATGTLCNITIGGESQGGEANARYDHRIWTFYNVDSKEEVRSTRQSFLKNHPEVHVNMLFSEKSHSWISKGWLVRERVSDEYMDALANNFRYEYSPIADKKMYSFINIDTEEIFEGTRHDLLKIAPNVNVTQLINKNKKTSKRWAMLDVYLETGTHKLRNPFASEHHPASDKTVYSFTNLNNNEIFVGTRTMLQQRVEKQLNVLFKKNPAMSVDGWCLTENVEKAIQLSRNDYIKYRFTHKSGEEFHGTKVEFKNFTGICPSPLFLSSPRKTCKGWSLIQENLQ